MASGEERQSWLHNAFVPGAPGKARVIMYGYDATASSGNCFTSRGIQLEAEALLAELLVLRGLRARVSISVFTLREVWLKSEWKSLPSVHCFLFRMTLAA